ncbi:hypothetical protein QE152_g39740 [Popillia japonica]|uniref:Uncharacterized protein n=1 Tax=Popillia japonica TaxID=7064 RepID=A0AAW1HT75_POPJA
MRFGEIFGKVWLKAMTPSNIISGFRATGIFPFNSDVIPESAFAPSLITQVEEINLALIENVVVNVPSTATANNKNSQNGASTSGVASKKSGQNKNKTRSKARTVLAQVESPQRKVDKTKIKLGQKSLILMFPVSHLLMQSSVFMIHLIL